MRSQNIVLLLLVLVFAGCGTSRRWISQTYGQPVAMTRSESVARGSYKGPQKAIMVENNTGNLYLHVEVPMLKEMAGTFTLLPPTAHDMIDLYPPRGTGQQSRVMLYVYAYSDSDYTQYVGRADFSVSLYGEPWGSGSLYGAGWVWQQRKGMYALVIDEIRGVRTFVSQPIYSTPR